MMQFGVLYGFMVATGGYYYIELGIIGIGMWMCVLAGMSQVASARASQSPAETSGRDLELQPIAFLRLLRKIQR